MTKQIKIVNPPSADIIEKVMMRGDLSALTDQQRMDYYKSVCDTLGLNVITKPLDYVEFEGKLVLYAKKDATDQLRKRYEISVKITSREKQDSIYVVTAQATLPNGRVDESIGAVSLIGYKKNGDEFDVTGKLLSNAVMKAETKSKRRVTLSICGIGMLDESELTDEYDQRTAEEKAEYRVRQATANAAVEAREATNEYGPLSITQSNYRELVSHVGKAQGRILGIKVGDMDKNVIEWMHGKWRDSLTPTASEQDLRLKKAIELAYQDLKAPVVKETGVEIRHDTAARERILAQLRDKVSDLVMTPETFCEHLGTAGYAKVKKLEELDDAQLDYLLQSWQTAKEVVENLVKPIPASETPKRKKGRGREL